MQFWYALQTLAIQITCSTFSDTVFCSNLKHVACLSVYIQELGFGGLQTSCTTLVPSKRAQVETLEPSTVILHQIIPMWGSGSHHKDWTLQGIFWIPSPFSLIMGPTIPPVILPFSFKIYPYSHLLPHTMVSTRVLCQMIKGTCRLYTLASTPISTQVCMYY